MKVDDSTVGVLNTQEVSVVPLIRSMFEVLRLHVVDKLRLEILFETV